MSRRCEPNDSVLRRLVADVSLNLLVALSLMPPIVHTVGSAVRNVALIGMGIALLASSPDPGEAAVRA
jgi:hypothetical protein